MGKQTRTTDSIFKFGTKKMKFNGEKAHKVSIKFTNLRHQKEFFIQFETVKKRFFHATP